MKLSVIDVSEHQGNIDWKKVRSAGVSGAMIRTGYGVSSPNQVDKQFYNNLSGCKIVGMPYGFYHYSYAMDVAGAEQEADFCLELIAGTAPQYPVAFDMEENTQAALGKAVCTDMAIAFCNKIRAAGYTPMLYTNLNWATNYIDMTRIDAAGIDVWMAQYNIQCDYKGAHTMWQYSSKAVIDGITANTADMNWCYKDYTNGAAFIPTPKPEPSYDTYTVMAGDTLSDIAAKFGTTYQELAAINGIEDPNMIHVGQIIKLKGNEISTPQGGTTYTVQAGDTLSGIAVKYGTTYQELAVLNGISDPNIIHVGQVLVVSQNSSSHIYYVQAGDSLWGIAQSQLGDGTRYQEIKALNGLSDDTIYPGQALQLP
ncbi:MAG: LysM peptidoglycan-binding domain-containing protein [Acutalibacteraceae bacterium]|nr:LysM peptidoglycan-binding domain-containing protein [Acutalibacteraceae bacterium]